jgi:hypothetical protein
MAYPEDASPNPFVGYYSPESPQTDIPSDAPGSQNSQLPLIHPRDLATPFAENPADISMERSAGLARLADQAVRQTEIRIPHFHIFHDRMRTTQGWEHQIDALFEGTIAAPAAGASTQVAVTAINDLGPGDPGKVIYPCVSFASFGAQGTTLTGLWSIDLLINGAVIPLGVYSGLAAATIRPELIGSLPFPGSMSQQSAIGQLQISILAGATVAAVTFYAQVAIAFVYDYIESLAVVREHDEQQRVTNRD